MTDGRPPEDAGQGSPEADDASGGAIEGTPEWAIEAAEAAEAAEATEGVDGVALSRRTVLAGLFGAGALGTAGGVGTAAMLGDGEVFRGLFASGAVDLWIDGASTATAQYDLVLDPATPVGSARIELALPPLPTAVNNPAYVRIRSECPVISGPSPFAVPDAVSLSIDYADCATDGVGDPVLAGTLRSLFDGSATGLLDGVLLDGQSRDVAPEARVAFEPGETVCLRLTWTLDPGALDDQARSIALTVHFDAVQARHSPGFDAPAVAPCTFDEPESRVSFVAFCSDAYAVRDGDVGFGPELVGTGDEYDAVRWAMTDPGPATQLSTVVLFAAGQFENFDVGQGDQAGFAALGAGTPGTPEQHPSSPGLPGEHWVKYEWRDGRFELGDESATAPSDDASDVGVNDADPQRYY